MLVTTEGIVIRERPVGETDRFIDVLTGENGVIEITVKGSRKSGGKFTGVTQMLAYGKFCADKRGERYYLNSVEPINTFYGLRLDVERLSLAMYFCELVKFTVSSEQPAQDVLRLFVNALYFLANAKRPNQLLKAVFELRLLSKLGFMPNLVACSECACYESDRMYFLPAQGILLCGDCMDGRPAQGERAVAISPAVLRAMRHCIYSELENVFNFKLPDAALRLLSDIAEDYLLVQLDRRFKTLDFYNTDLHLKMEE